MITLTFEINISDHLHQALGLDYTIEEFFETSINNNVIKKMKQDHLADLPDMKLAEVNWLATNYKPDGGEFE